MINKLDIKPWIRISIFSIIFVVSLVSNLCILTVILIKKSLRTKSNYLLANVAFSDLYVTFIVLIPMITNLAKETETLSRVEINLIGSGILTGFMASCLNLTLIAFHRYILIVKTAYYEKIFSKHKLLAIIGAIWLLCLALACIPFTGFGRYTYNYYLASPTMDWGYEFRFILTVMILLFGTPMFLMIYWFYCIVKTTKDSRRRVTETLDITSNRKKMQVCHTKALNSIDLPFFRSLVCKLLRAIDINMFMIGYVSCICS